MGGEDAYTVADLVLAGFFAIWMVSDLSDPVTLKSFQTQIALLKTGVDKASALRVMRTFARVHQRSHDLLPLIDEMAAIPW